MINISTNSHQSDDYVEIQESPRSSDGRAQLNMV
jgi:hypothetical protein